MPWPPRSTELRRIDWSEYLRNPRIGVLVDPETGEPFGDVITVRARVLDQPPIASLDHASIGEVVEISLLDYLTAETHRIDLGRIPWVELIEFRVKNQPPPLELQKPRKGLPKNFDEVKQFLYEVLEDGPVSELEVIGRAADNEIPISTLREVKERLRIASIKDPNTEYPRTLWRLRMSQSYKLQKRRAPDARK